MKSNPFPPVELADEHGLLAVGGDLNVETLVFAYQNGIFPWPIFEEDILTWFAPPKRTLLFLNDFHLPRSLAKAIRQTKYQIQVNQHFSTVIRACAEQQRKGQEGTWITEAIVKAYEKLHQAGYAHSVECWMQGELVGGLYGVSLGRMFAGESMFHTKTNASKFCLHFLVEYLRERGVEWIDCQQKTALFAAFGAKEISRERFMQLLKQAIKSKQRLF